jgi:hypothetical protein
MPDRKTTVPPARPLRKTSFVKRMNPKTGVAEQFPGADPTNPSFPEDPTRLQPPPPQRPPEREGGE